MRASDVCKSYFNGIQELSNYKTNNKKTTILAALKTISYFTIVLPLGFAVVYGASSLSGRISKKEDLCSSVTRKLNQVKDFVKTKIFKSGSKDELDIDVLRQKAREFAERSEYENREEGELLNYINDILDQTSFCENPQKYVQDWRTKRGHTEEFRGVEDIALDFFENIKFD